MLKMECSNCNEWIHLPFHSQCSEVVCSGCSALIPVKEVFVAAGPFLISRDVLHKNIYKYKRLVLEAEKEANEIQKKGNGQRSHDLSARSINMFISNLKELLGGCRDTIRHRLEDDKVEYTITRHSYKGHVVNISLSGICIDSEKAARIDKLWSEIVIHLKTSADTSSLPGKIVWLGSNMMGIKFLKNDGQTRKVIEDYIIEKSLLKRI